MSQFTVTVTITVTVTVTVHRPGYCTHGNAFFYACDAQYQGRSALSWAAEKGHIEVVKALLHAKADPNIRDGLVSHVAAYPVYVW